MRIVVVMFGGLDHEFLAKWDCKNLRQVEWGPVVVDELWNQRDVASAITAQLITGKTWRENGVPDRFQQTEIFRRPAVQWLEERLLRNCRLGRVRRRAFYRAFGWLDVIRRGAVRSDLKCPSLFDKIQPSKAVYVPAYNPEPSWALDRNILDPRRYPELGFEGALDLRDKNYSWRRRKFMEALAEGPFQLLMGQFQYIDSTQHLYLSYHEPPLMEEVERAYWRMDAFAAEILAAASGRYDRVLFVSDNGAARKNDFRPTHYNRPFYSLSYAENLSRPNLRDFHDLILAWARAEPNPAAIIDPSYARDSRSRSHPERSGVLAEMAPDTQTGAPAH
jgi:hypothetical protein